MVTSLSGVSLEEVWESREPGVLDVLWHKHSACVVLVPKLAKTTHG